MTISHPPTSDAAYSGSRPAFIRNIRSIRSQKFLFVELLAAPPRLGITGESSPSAVP
jgi:hypothetical protein